MDFSGSPSWIQFYVSLFGLRGLGSHRVEGGLKREDGGAISCNVGFLVPRGGVLLEERD